MKSLDQFFQSEIVHALGWTIIHSFWQGLLIVLLLTAGLVALRRHSSRLRYLAGYLALLALSLGSAGTFLWRLSTRSTGASLPSAPSYGATAEGGISSAVTLSETSVSAPAGEAYWQLFIGFLEGSLPLITMIWMLGVLILALRFLAELAYIQRLKYQPGQPPSRAYQDLLDQLARRMGIDKSIELKETIRIGTPMVIGFVKPVILAPLGLLSSLDPQQVETVLAHELAHIRRHDYVLNLFQSLVEIVLFFNPATWWISALIRTERENCCDDIAIAETGNRLVFVQTLARLEEYRTLSSRMALAFHGPREGGLLGRVKRIVDSEEQFSVPHKLFWSSMILLCSVGLFAFQGRPAPAEDPVSIDNAIPEALASYASVDPAEPAESDQTPAPEEPENREERIAPADAGETPSHFPAAEKFMGNGLDTLPENLKKLRQEIIRLEKEFQEQEMAFQQQSRVIQAEIMKHEREIQAMENEQMKQLFAVEKSAQEIELNRNIKLQQLEIDRNALENETLELEYNMQQLEVKMGEEGAREERQKQQTALHRQLIDLEKKKRELELSQKRQDLDQEKEMQLLKSKQWQLQQEAQIAQNSKRLEIMELEQKLQEAQFKAQMLQNEKQNKIRLLQLQMQEEMEKQTQKNER